MLAASANCHTSPRQVDTLSTRGLLPYQLGCRSGTTPRSTPQIATPSTVSLTLSCRSQHRLQLNNSWRLPSQHHRQVSSTLRYRFTSLTPTEQQSVPLHHRYRAVTIQRRTTTSSGNAPQWAGITIVSQLFHNTIDALLPAATGWQPKVTTNNDVNSAPAASRLYGSHSPGTASPVMYHSLYSRDKLHLLARVSSSHKDLLSYVVVHVLRHKSWIIRGNTNRCSRAKLQQIYTRSGYFPRWIF